MTTPAAAGEHRPASPSGDSEVDRSLLKMTRELAAASLERVISPSLAAFLA